MIKTMLHSNKFFAVSVFVIAAWAAALTLPAFTVQKVDCPYRVSARGVVHGPDSPWHGVTAPNPCFQTKWAAKRYAEKIP